MESQRFHPTQFLHSFRIVTALIVSICFTPGYVAAAGDGQLLEKLTSSLNQHGYDRSWNRHESGEVVLDWVEHTFETVRSQNVGTPAAGRLYAMTFAAMFDAVNGINRQRHWRRGYQHALIPPHYAPRRASKTAAAAAAAHAVLTELYPAATEALDSALEQSLAGRRGRVERGIAWGEYVGAAVVSLRSTDGTQESEVFTPTSTDPGVFRTTFDARYAYMTPFAINSAIPYLLNDPPPALTSAEYADSLNQVFNEGSDQDTDLERHDIALQWETPGGTIRPTGSAIQAAVALARSERTTRNLARTARLFALIGMSVADTLIPVWHGKAENFTWRPKPAIQRADEDGNPGTLGDPTFQTRFGSTGGSPEYPSGQAAFTSAVAIVLEKFYRNRHLSWCFSSDSNLDGRCYDSARHMGNEGGESRIYQGVHFSFTVEASRSIGKGVGREVVRTAMQRIRH